MPVEDRSNSTSSLLSAQRLGRNQGRYLGETIEVEAVLTEIQALALKQGWRRDCILQTERLCVASYHRKAPSATKRLYISAGIHGDEPAGPMAVLELMRENRWPESIDLWVCPCLNPSGFPLNTRENFHGLDLNRQYHAPKAEEIVAHVRWLESQPRFDVTLCLHEDWEAHGFYVYELNLDRRPSLAEAIIKSVSEVCPIDLSPVIEGREAQGGIIRPSADPFSRPEWPEALYLIKHKTRASCTLEAPSDFPLQTRVAALVAAMRAVLDVMEKVTG